MNKIRKNSHSIRWRLTLWFTVTLALSLIIFSIIVYIAMFQALNLELEATLHDGASTLAENLKHEFEEGDSVQDASETVIRESSFRNLIVEIYSPNGELIASSENLSGPLFVAELDLSAIPVAKKGSADSPIRDITGFKIAAARVSHPGTNELYTIVVGGRKSIVTNELATLRNIIFSLAPVLLLVAGIGGYALSKRTLKPVADMTSQARTMNAGHLSERLTVSDPDDELGQLAQTFNEFFDRIEESFEQMRQFIADASHELRTPVTVIRSEADVALTEPRGETEAFASLEIIRDEAARMSRLVEDMFQLVRADADDRNILRIEEVPLAGLVDTCVRSVKTLADSRRTKVFVKNELPPELICRGDRMRLAQMLLNLLDNAIKYTPAGGLVTVSAKISQNQPEQRQAVISISDNGPGIPSEFREAVFIRFYRLDKARTRTFGGSGLGLPIARRIAELHNGTLTLAESEGRGASFTVTLPVKFV